MIKKHSTILVLFTLLAVIFASSADARFPGKRKKKHLQEQSATPQSDSAAAPQKELTKKEKRAKKKKEKEERKKQKKEQKQKERDAKKKGGTVKKMPVKPTVPLVKRRAEIIYPQSKMKPRYRIDVLADLYLDDLVAGKYVTYKDNIPDRAIPGAAFIEGINIAADSLKKAGYSLDIYVHDVISFSESADILVRAALDSSDLIIGAVQSRDVPTLAAFARKKHIYFISALTAADAGVKDNEYFTITQPGVKTQCERMIADIAKKYPGQRAILLYRTSMAGDESSYGYVWNDTTAKVIFKPVLCNTLPAKQSLATVIDTIQTNVVMVPVQDIVYADSLLKTLAHSFPKVHFEVYGMPSWTGMADLQKAKIFPNVAVTVTEPFSFNVSNASGAYIERTFKKEFAGKTSEMVYRGYETLFWYASLLKQYGTVFKYTDNAPTPFTPYEISPQWDRNNDLLYNENTHVYLTRYENGKMTADASK